MKVRSFQWTLIGLLFVTIFMLGIVTFLIWNQQVDRERPLARDNPSPRETGSGEDQSEGPPDSGAPQREHVSLQGGPGSAQEDQGDAKAAEGEKPPRQGGPGNRHKNDSALAEGAKTYQIDATASRIYVKVGSATRIGHPHGVEGALKSGTVTFGAGGELVFDMRSFKADTKEARKKVGLESKKISENEAKKVQIAMLSADVLDVEKFPTATYKIIMIKPEERQEAGAPGLYQLNGRLTLHGAEQPVLFKAKLERTDKEGIVKLSGSFAIKQTDYGITPYSAAAGLARVADELEITGELFLNSAK
jgi:polyisoprenoid-binding protein YceI